MSIDREDVLLAFRALKGGLPAGDVKKAIRKQNALPVRKSLFEVFRSELKVSEETLAPIRASGARPDPRADRGLLDQISRMVVDEGVLTSMEFEKLASSVAASMPSAIHPPIEVPPKLGDYEVRWEMRRDAHSGVYHGSHPQRGDVALKVFRKGSAPEGLGIRFTESHPGLNRILDIGEAEGFKFVVTELIEGQPLARLLKARKLTAREALEIAEKAGRTLVELNERGFFHGSLRSSDVFVDKDSVRIKDFGGVEGSAAGDYRAYAEILYEGAAGVPPYGPDDLRDVPPPAPGDVNKALDPEANRLVVAAMQGRYPSIRPLVEDLGRHLRGEKILLPASRKGSKAAVLVGVAAAALVGIAVVVYAATRPKTDPAPKEAPKQEESKPEPKREQPKDEPKKIEEKKEETRETPPDPDGPMNASEEREIEEHCYRASRTDIDELGRIAERAVRRGPKRPWSEYYYARFLFEKGRYREGLVHADEAATLQPESVPYVELRSRLLLACGEWNRSREDLKARFGKDYLKLNQQIRMLDSQLATNPRDGVSCLERGAFWAYRPDWERAERDFTAALDCGHLVALQFRAFVRERMKRYREALEDVTRYLRESPDAGGKAEATALKTELEKRVKPE